MIGHYQSYRYFKRYIKDSLVNIAIKHLGVFPGELNQPLPLISYLGEKCRGIIHVGANTGQEFDSYRQAGLESVIYIEPVPEIFEVLKRKISVNSRHQAFQALCSDIDGRDVDFHIASNGGQSSSMLELGSTKEEHPNVRYLKSLQLRTTTLDKLIFETSNIDYTKLDCLVMDVQGAELKVIRGAEKTLAHCRFVFAEISEGGLYQGDVPYAEIIAALGLYGFKLKAFGINTHRWGNAFFMK